MEHKLSCKTKYGGFVCSCERYFDDKEQLNEHIKDMLVKGN